jgi:hypothetical protein
MTDEIPPEPWIQVDGEYDFQILVAQHPETGDIVSVEREPEPEGFTADSEKLSFSVYILHENYVENPTPKEQVVAKVDEPTAALREGRERMNELA